MRLNLDDPVSMHLLMETAIGDSQDYEILSFEEVDALKKQLALLSNRIDSTRRKLVLESKLRDAASSISRLHSTNNRESVIGGPGNSPRRHRRSIMGSRGSNNDFLSKTDDELAASIRKCEDLAQELWTLEKRSQILQKRLLKHTAGVLQITHKGYLEKDITPASPESVPDFRNGRNGQEMPYILDGVDEFDDRSFYEALDTMLDLGNGDKSHPSEHPAQAFAHHTQSILETERRLEDLNQRLRDSILQASSRTQPLPELPIRPYEDDRDPVGALQEQLIYLENGLSIMQQDQHTVLHIAKKSAYATEERLEDLNTQLHGMVTRAGRDPNAEYPLPPELSGKNSEAQIKYLERGLDEVEQAIQRLTDVSIAKSSKTVALEEKSEQVETLLSGLWEIIRAGEEDSRKQPQACSEGPDDPQRSPSMQDDFTLQGFSAKVQALSARAKVLQEQKEILTKQVQQQRELNSKSDAEKDAQFSDLTLALDQSKKSLELREKEAKESRDEIVLLMGRLDAIQEEATLQGQQRAIDESNTLQAEKDARREIEEHLYAELQAKQDEYLKLESKLQEFRDDSGIANAETLAKLDDSESHIHELTSKLTAVNEDLEHRQTSEAETLASLDQAERHIHDLTVKLNALNNDLEHRQANDVETLAQLDQDERHIHDLTSKLAALNEDIKRRQTSEAILKHAVEQKNKELEEAHQEMHDLETQLVRLQTEVTVARAELDGAYGTRAQRAAEVTMNPAIQKELDGLTEKNSSLLTELASMKAYQKNLGEENTEMAQRVQVLQRELSETISEYEAMTKASIEFEKDREKLENAVDGLRERCESLETELSDEKVRWLGAKSPGASGGRDSHPPGTTSTMILKNEFKKMMRETRAENLKALRVSCFVGSRHSYS